MTRVPSNALLLGLGQVAIGLAHGAEAVLLRVEPLGAPPGHAFRRANLNVYRWDARHKLTRLARRDLAWAPLLRKARPGTILMALATGHFMLRDFVLVPDAPSDFGQVHPDGLSLHVNGFRFEARGLETWTPYGEWVGAYAPAEQCATPIAAEMWKPGIGGVYDELVARYRFGSNGWQKLLRSERWFASLGPDMAAAYAQNLVTRHTWPWVSKFLSECPWIAQHLTPSDFLPFLRHEDEKVRRLAQEWVVRAAHKPRMP